MAAEGDVLAWARSSFFSWSLCGFFWSTTDDKAKFNTNVALDLIENFKF
jgi:hypothetical protein